jgi:hypothetical protein
MKNLLIAGYPKCGNTWIGYLLSYYFNAPYYDAYIEEKILSGEQVVEKLDYKQYAFSGKFYRTDQVKEVNAVVKTHELPENLWKQHRLILDFVGYTKSDPLILITRAPKDVAVSLFYFTFFRLPQKQKHWSRRIPYFLRHWYYRLHFKEFALNVAREWSKFTEAWLKLNPLVIRYEDLLEDPVREIHRVTQYFKFKFYEAYATEAKEYCDFSNMVKHEVERLNSAIHRNERFFRSGRSGQWKEHFSADLEAEFDCITCQVASMVGY